MRNFVNKVQPNIILRKLYQLKGCKQLIIISFATRLGWPNSVDLRPLSVLLERSQVRDSNGLVWLHEKKIIIPFARKLDLVQNL